MTDPDPIPAPMIEHASAPPMPPARARRGAGGTFFTLFLFLLLAGGLYYVWTNPQGQADPDALPALQRQVQAQSQTASQQAAQLASLAQQLQPLADRIDKLEHAVSTAQAATTAVPQAPAADLGDLPQRVDALTAKVAALANQPAPAPAQAPDFGDLPQRVQALSAKVAALANQPAPQGDTGAPQQALAALSQQVEQAEAADRSALGQVRQESALGQAQGELLAQQKSAIGALDGRLSKLEQGAGTIEDAASRAARLGRVQAAIVALEAGQKLGTIPGAPPELARFATQPPPTEANLRQTFPALAAHAREVSQPPTAHRTFLQRALARLQQSVTIRQGDDVLVGDPAAGVLSDAEVHVQNGDLAGAVQRLGALSGPAAMAMAGWVGQARALVAARVALANMAARG